MGTEKRARQKAGTQARREAAQQAAARAKRRRTIIRGGVVVLAVLGVFLGLTLSGQEDEPATTAPTPPVGAEVTAETADGADDSDGNDMTAEDGDDAATETETPGNDMTAEDGSGEVAGTPEIAPAGGPDYVSYTVEDYGSGPCAPAAGVAEPVLHFDSAPMLCIDTSVPHTATFDTSRGVVRVALDVANTPGTVNSFVNLARFGYYDDTLVHRSAPSIGILQGGSPHTNTAADPGPGYTLWDEGTGFTYRPGQLVMARRNEPNSAGAQYFFTVTDDAGLLDGQGTYVVFGEVIEGLDVLSDILASHVDEPDNPLGGAPDPPVVVDSVTIEAG
ncbi:MAG: peptidylprolyl isomerase [Acidimicrobiia bacterium]|nr:peptidylprolyl isomerase [Acidimicrobiia bacterium]